MQSVFFDFLDEKSRLVGVEAGGRSLEEGGTCRTI